MDHSRSVPFSFPLELYNYETIAASRRGHFSGYTVHFYRQTRSDPLRVPFCILGHKTLKKQ